MIKSIATLLAILSFAYPQAQTRSLHELQQEFVDLQFGLFLHFNIPTFAPDDWPDPDLSPDVFNPVKLDCRQWAKAVKITITQRNDIVKIAELGVYTPNY